jgi:hypothetical protein
MQVVYIRGLRLLRALEKTLICNINRHFITYLLIQYRLTIKIQTRN